MKNIYRLKEITITIVISYLIISYISNEFNPSKLSVGMRFFQVFATTVFSVLRKLFLIDFKNK